MFSRRRPKLEKYIFSPNELSDSLDNVKSTQFDGINEYAVVPNNPIHQLASQASISVWFKMNTVASAFYCLISKLTGAFQGFGIFTDAISQISGFLDITTIHAFPLPTGTGLGWHHYAIVGNGTTAKGFFDGVAGTPIASAITPNITDPVIIGSIFGGIAFMNGNIDEVSIWNRALTDAEVQEIYNSKKPQNLFNHSRAVNLISWWRMGDDDTFPTIKDVKSGANGTMTNMEAGDFVSGVP